MSLSPRLADWNGKLAWVVGASSGIGRATAAALHAADARVAVSARDAAALEAFVLAHPGAIALPLDITNLAAVHTAYGELARLHGVPDLVFCCAGHYRSMRATDFDVHEAQRHIAINQGGTLHLLDAVLPGMLDAGRGHISLMGSVAGYRGLPRALAYGPTKAALINLAEILYMDLRDRGVGVSIVNPGFVRTPLTAQNAFHMPAMIGPEQAAAEILAGWRAGRFEIHFPRRFTWGLKALQWAWPSLYFALLRRTTGN